MHNITIEHIKSSIKKFLKSEVEKQLKQEIAALKRPTDLVISKKREKLNAELNYDDWIKELVGSIITMNSQTISFATHTSKGVHSSVKGNNAIYLKGNSTSSFIGSHKVPSLNIDATSNNTGGHAGHLKRIIEFLNIDILGSKIYELIINKNIQIKKYLIGISIDNSEFIYDYFHNSLTIKITKPITDGRNKQTLFPITENNYVTTIPLYPSSLTNFIFQIVQINKYSEEIKEQRENRKNSKKGKQYSQFTQLAYIKLGGENAQNVSRLNNQQSGINYLLPSMPPIFKSQRSLRLTPYSESLFNKQLTYHCREPLNSLFKLIQTNYNNVNIRNARKTVLDSILYKVLTFAVDIQNNETPGWSINYNLNHHEKLWLDPQRADLEDQEPFKQDRASKNWRDEIAVRFANWLNTHIQKKFKQLKHDFGDIEHIEWQKEMTEMINESQRLGKEVFA